MIDIQMVDLRGQHARIQEELDCALLTSSHQAAYINGPEVGLFASDLSTYLGGDIHTIPCANGTDALQIALMALDLKEGDEVITPTFTYIATAEVVALLGLKLVLVDVNPDTFTLDISKVRAAITDRTKVIVPVHLYGQAADMEELKSIAEKHNIVIIEDNAQALGAKYRFSDGSEKALGTIGAIGCTSFFPSKNLGCMGDGGAIFTSDDDLAERIKMIANHGQKVKYRHDCVGCNSRLDTLQASILRVKLKYLDQYAESRRKAAELYDLHLGNLPWLKIPTRSPNSTHVFHQYTLRVVNGKRDELATYLKKEGIPTMIYYPLPVHFQAAFKEYRSSTNQFQVAEKLCLEVISLPMHTELTEEVQLFIVNKIKSFND